MHLVYRPMSPTNIITDQPRTPTTTTPTSAPTIVDAWDEPPTLPPKLSRGFGFPSKASFSTFSLRTSSSTLLRPRTSDSHSTLSTSEGHRLSADDDSVRERLPSTASSATATTTLDAPSIRKSKSSIFNRLRNSRSKSRLRADSHDGEHPSLHKPPPIPDAQNALLSARATVHPPFPSPPPPIVSKKEKKKKTSDSRPPPPSPPPKDRLDEAGLKNINLLDWQVNDLISEGIIGAGGQPAPPMADQTSSPSSGIDSSTDHSIFLFNNPFLPSTSSNLQSKRTARIYNRESRRISPKDRALLEKSLPTSPVEATGAGLLWKAPESWGVDKNDLDADYESSVDDDYGADVQAIRDAGAERPMSFAMPRLDNSELDPHDFLDMAQNHHPASPPTRRRKGRKRPVTPYTVRIYKDDDQFHEATMALSTTVAELVPKLNEKLPVRSGETYRLYVRERGRERLLGMTEKPAGLIKRRLEHHGYYANDGLILLPGDKLSFLIRFIYRSIVFAPDKQVTINSFEHIDLEHRALVAIPIAVHKNAEKVVSLKLSGNPILEIPLDFIQSCTSLRDLRLSNMFMKSVPTNVRHATTLRRLDLSSNRIGNLEEASLDRNVSLEILNLQNNRIENLPWYFPRLRSLTTLNISNNKFHKLPPVICQLEALVDLDISFNMISELPEEIGKLVNLTRFTILGNSITQLPEECSKLVNLSRLDCRRNELVNLGVVTGLPKLQVLIADHNAVHGLDLSLGPHLRTLNASHNEITQLTLVPEPAGRAPYALTSLDISHAKLSSLDDLALGHLSSLRHLCLDHNSFLGIPETLGDLLHLETFSCSDNKLTSLPASIGNLQRLTVLDAHNNSLTELPYSLWNCAALEKMNITSNLLGMWYDPPTMYGGEPVPVPVTPDTHGLQDAAGASSSSPPPSGQGSFDLYVQRKASTASFGSSASSTSMVYPPLAYSLRRLYLGENHLTDDALHPIMQLRELRVLNLSFNQLQDLPRRFFGRLGSLEEVYLSGNKIASIPTEDLHRLEKLRTLYLNGNRMYTLPQELQRLRNLTSLDVGSNQLKYNTNNWEFDWNWNFNKNLKYLNLSGNNHLQIKVDKRQTYYGHGPVDRHHPAAPSSNMSGFTDLTQLRVLGLMDVTLPGTAVTTPDENDERRVRTSPSTILKMSYGIADALGKNDTLNMLDLVQEIHTKKESPAAPGAMFAMFGRSQPHKPPYPGAKANRLAKYIHDHFVKSFLEQLERMKNGDDVPDALRRSFLETNRSMITAMRKPAKDLRNRKNSVSTNGEKDLERFPSLVDGPTMESGASGIVVYIKEPTRTMYVANAGDSLAVVSRQGIAQLVAKRHDPFDRRETARIRTAEGWVSPSGHVNGMVDVSRSFGFTPYMPAVNAGPDVFTYHLTLKDEFVIIADRSLWDFVSYQTAVDIARSERADPMIAAQKLRDFAISYGAEGSTMIMVIGLAEAPELEVPKKKDQILDRSISRLDGEVPAPVGHIALVFSDIRNSTHLWEVNSGMATAHKLHNNLLRRLLRFCGGYEVKTEGDAFMCSFPTSLAAVWWCLSVQSELLNVSWPLEILECEDGKPMYDSSGVLVARGLSVRMGIHCGTPKAEPDPITHRMDYFGSMVNRSARICGAAAGGEIMCSAEILREINASIYDGEMETEYSKLQPAQAIDEIRQMGLHIVSVGEVKLKGLEVPENISVLYPFQLAGRQNLGQESSTASGSRIPFSVEQMQELGVICLRLETLTTSRIFKVLPERKGSIQTVNIENEPDRSSSLKLHGDPNVLLPPMNAHTTDAELMILLDSLATRIVNALASLEKDLTPPQSEPLYSKTTIMSALEQDGEIDERTLERILSLLNRIP
ncbi:hypothetical protein H0H92_010744 [Tricholoma furcatifolium]|nr:hypothetical protein H0H92_010744 [Tricholoma furcatifolium]